MTYPGPAFAARADRAIATHKRDQLGRSANFDRSLELSSFEAARPN
jgi:hypothetical protein